MSARERWRSPLTNHSHSTPQQQLLRRHADEHTNTELEVKGLSEYQYLINCSLAACRLAKGCCLPAGRAGPTDHGKAGLQQRSLKHCTWIPTGSMEAFHPWASQVSTALQKVVATGMTFRSPSPHVTICLQATSWSFLDMLGHQLLHLHWSHTLLLEHAVHAAPKPGSM